MFLDMLWNNTEAFGMLTWNAQNIWCFWKRTYFWKRPLSRQIIREANMNYFETGKLVYPGVWSQDVQYLCSLKCFWYALLMLSIVTSSYSNETKSLGPSREYFMVVGFGSELSLCTNSSLILVSLTPFFHDLKLHKQLI